MMYDEETRRQALALVASGMSAREASARMGGHPGHAIIQRWYTGDEPTGSRTRPACMLTAAEKVRVVRRVDAGENYRDVAQEVGCAPSTVLVWRKLYHEGGMQALRTNIDRYEDARYQRGPSHFGE